MRFFAWREILVLTVVGLIAAPGLWADPPKRVIEAEMSAAERAATGLDRLTDEEREALNAWLAMHYAGTASQPSPEPPTNDEDAFGLEDVRERVEEVFQKAAPDELVSTIPGNFRGWSGKTVFRLSNGQVWKQASSGRFVVNLDDPTVTIERGTFGAYYLSVEGYGSRVRVKRLR